MRLFGSDTEEDDFSAFSAKEGNEDGDLLLCLHYKRAQNFVAV